MLQWLPYLKLGARSTDYLASPFRPLWSNAFRQHTLRDPTPPHLSTQTKQSDNSNTHCMAMENMFVFSMPL